MKATGIVRRIDELGRIVIPKEIRRVLRIREGDPIEIFTEEDGVVLKKYARIRELGDYAETYCQALTGALGFSAAVTDTETVLFASTFTVTSSARTAMVEKELPSASLEAVEPDRSVFTKLKTDSSEPDFTYRAL